MKKISVIIPNYNYANYINERLESIINQTYPVHEIIILDDNSTDNSVEIIEQFIEKHKNINIKLIANKKNQGVFAQWLKGIENITGDYFWIAEADDLSKPNFLETVIKGFDDKKTVLSYCETERINEKGKVIEKNSRGWVDIFQTGIYDKDFIMDGNTFIRNQLSILNVILNVSSVVWKKGDYKKFFNAAKEFKVAGDWYIYSNVLKDGNVAYFCESLNRQRKHSMSISTIVNRDIEFDEITKIQNMINGWYKPSREIVYKQNIRKNFLFNEISNSKQKELKGFKRKNIAVIFPYPVKGSGGHRTVVQNVNSLINYGHCVDIYVGEDYVSTDSEMKKMVEAFYGKCLADVYVGIRMRKDYDLIFATAWTTAESVKYLKAPKKAYFIQDYEPWFEPMGNSYITAENSYKYGFYFITIGKWLCQKISKEFNQPAKYFDFCADLNTYRKLDNIKKENAICFVYQPEKWRRCTDLGMQALKIVKEQMPDVKIYLYGSKVEGNINFEAENLHIIPIEKCNEIYNRCKVGLCLSSSNPSRIPFEMMATGLPVVELYRENNLYDMPNESVLLAESTPEGLATAIMKILKDNKLQEKMSKAGIQYMKDKDLSQGFVQFTEAVMDMFEDNYDVGDSINKSYKKEIIVGDKNLKTTDGSDIPALYVSPNGPFMRKLVKIKRKLVHIRYMIFRR